VKEYIEKMWAPLVTLAALLGHSSGQIFPTNPSGFLHQSSPGSPWNTFDTSHSSLFHPQKQCVQQVIDADSLLKIITKIVDDIPNICLSKFKMCGGFEQPAPSLYPPPPLEFPDFRSAPSNDIPTEEEVVEEVFEDGNGTETSSGKTRQRRSAPGYGSHGHAGYGGYGHGGYGSIGYGGYGGYGHGYNHLYAPSLNYYAPGHHHRTSLWNLAYQNPAFKNAYLGHLYHKKNYEGVPEAVH
jgi:hypothetical protein